MKQKFLEDIIEKVFANFKSEYGDEIDYISFYFAVKNMASSIGIRYRIGESEIYANGAHLCLFAKLVGHYIEESEEEQYKNIVLLIDDIEMITATVKLKEIRPIDAVNTGSKRT